MDLSLRGWVELDGRRLLEEEIMAVLSDEPQKISDFGGEFFLEWKRPAGPGIILAYFAQILFQIDLKR